MRSVRAAVVAGLGCTVGCAAEPRARPRSLPEVALHRLEAAPTSYAPPPAALAAFRGEASAHAAVDDALRQAGRNAVGDPALDCVASVVLEVVAEERRRPAPWLDRWIRWRCGVVDDDVSVRAWSATGRSAESTTLGAVARSAPDALGRSGSVYGTTYERRGQLHVAVLVTATRLVTLDPTPKRAQPGATVTIAGRLAPGTTDPSLWVDEPKGRERRVPAIRSPAPVSIAEGSPAASGASAATCSFAWTTPSVPGKYYVELRVGNGDRHSTAAWFPMFVGVDEPASPDPPAAPATPPGDMPTALGALFDRWRRAAGLGPLTREPLLARIAQQRTASRASEQTIESMAHDLAAAVVDVPTWLASSAVVDDATDAFTLALAYPHGRAFLRDPKTRFVGIAATPRQNQDEGVVPEMFLTWILAKPRLQRAPAASAPHGE